MKIFKVKGEWKSRNNPGIKTFIFSSSEEEAKNNFNQKFGKYYDLTSIIDYGTIFNGKILVS